MVNAQEYAQRYVAFINEHNLDRADEFYADDIVFHDPVPAEKVVHGLEGMKLAPVFVPMGSPFGSAVTLRVMPPAGTMPDDGVTVSHGTFGVATKLVPSAAAMAPRAELAPTLPPITIW